MRRIAVSAALLLLAVHGASAAAGTRLEVAYSVYLTGLRVGRAAVTVDFDKEGFVASGSARSSGLLRMISKGEGSASTRGSFKGDRVIASLFSAHLRTGKRDEKIELEVENGFAKKISLDPPRNDTDKNRVPITGKTRTGVVDPLSAMLALVAPKGELVAPEACNRTLPIFDGRYRFNVVLSYVRTENAPKKIEGYAGPVLVCQARYVPIAGHRDRDTVRQMAENRDMFVWLAPVAGTRVLVPVRASVSSMIGTFTVEATRFKTSTQ
ncbi:MAG: DUF3108 domain-containing protein [Xanthobacteraceae bacterium]|nr:DUF3108 domain-containing protein [Xanthobacteraceae bacterium]MCW5672977.1 DUF3108 domain-containing protein [Xanthobacteraceae bacterium]